MWGSNLLVALLALYAIWWAPWRQWLAMPARQHAWLGMSLGAGFMWCLKAAPLPDLHVHFLAATIMVVVFGWRLGLLCGLVALAISTGLGAADWAAYGVNALVSLVLPGAACWGLLRVLQPYSRRQVFVFFLGGGFAGGMLAVLVTAAAAVGVLALSGRGEDVSLALDSSALLPMLMFGEGFLNGLLATTLATYMPDLVKTFEDQWLE